MNGLYLLALVFSIAGLCLFDYRYKLAFFRDRRRTSIILVISVAIFIVWDIAGILANIFFIGSDRLLTGLTVGEFPIEELFFLILLNYVSLLTYLFVKKRYSLT